MSATSSAAESCPVFASFRELKAFLAKSGILIQDLAKTVEGDYEFSITTGEVDEKKMMALDLKEALEVGTWKSDPLFPRTDFHDMSQHELAVYWTHLTTGVMIWKRYMRIDGEEKPVWVEGWDGFFADVSTKIV